MRAARPSARPGPGARARLPLLVFGCCLAVLPATARGQTIRGVVLEEGRTDPVQGATIELLGADSTLVVAATSDGEGWFQLEAEREGRYLLRPSHPSYSATRTASVSVGRHEIVTVVLRMGRTAIPLEPLVVTARSRNRLAGFYERAERGRPGHFVRRDYIERRVSALPSQLLMMTPGVRLIRSDDGMSNTITISGSGGRCTPSIFLDGLPVPPGITTVDDLTAANLIEGIEVYDNYGLVPAAFNVQMDNYCGIVAFWSRRDAFRPMTNKRWAIGLAAIAGFVLLTRL